MKKKKWLVISFILLIIVWTTFYFSDDLEKIIWKNKIQNNKEQNNKKWDNKTNTKKEKKVYEHTFAEKVSKENFFKWEFISNDVASVYPRRSALVKDILVDIWDKVVAWTTLAILFEPWIAWEAKSKINIKSTLTKTKTNLLWNIIEVKKAKLAEIDTKINEKWIIINETEKNFDSKISQIKNLIKNKTNSEDSSVDNKKQTIPVEEKVLANLEENLKNALSSKTEILNNAKNNITQKKDLLDSKIEEVLYKIIPVFYIANEKEMQYDKINIYDLSDLFWAKNSKIRKELLREIRKFQVKISQKDNFSTKEKYDEITIINNLLIKTLQNTIVSVNSTEKNIANNINSINMYNTELITIKENYDDSLKNYDILIRKQNEKIGNFEKQIEKQKEIINLKKSSVLVVSSWKTEKIDNLEFELKKIKTSKSLAISKLKAELETLKKSKKLLEARENQNITSIKNEIAVAKSNLNNEYIKSWDYRIISPFSWIISKRSLEIGEKISANKEVFRITWVKNSLSKITKKEVKFFVPESLKENIKLKKEISFYFWNNKNKSFTWSIYRIAPEIDEKNFSILVQAKVSDKIKLPNKSTINVNLETTELMFKIPSSTVYNKWERKIVYYKKDNWKLWIRDINIISEDWEFSLISGEIDEKLKIVITPIFVK